MAGVFLSLRRVLPARYPLALDVERYIADEQRLGRLLDYAVIVPRLQRLYEWSAEELGEPHLLELLRNGNPFAVGRHAARDRFGDARVAAFLAGVGRRRKDLTARTAHSRLLTHV
jgi:hypothetical protein